MNLKTTLVLLVLLGAGGFVFWAGLPVVNHQPAAPPAPEAVDARSLLAEVNGAKLSRIRVHRDGQDKIFDTVLERKGKTWSLRGNWRPRAVEVQALVDFFGKLHSRFEPELLGATEKLLNPVEVTLEAEGGKKYQLTFGERPLAAGSSAFVQPTYVHLGGTTKVLRLSPGLRGVLDRPTDYYQQRRLFPYERVARDEEHPQEKVERLLAQGLTVDEKAADPKDGKSGLHFTLRRVGDEWQLEKPAVDRLDPVVRDTLLTAVPDVWAEQLVGTEPTAVAAALGSGPCPLARATAWFLTTPKGLRARAGLDHPARTLTITNTDGSQVILQIGNVSGVRSRTVRRPPPQGLPPGMPRRPTEQTIFEEYRYARLAGDEQIFEVRNDRIKDVFVALDVLRDPQVARFKPTDVTRLEVTHRGEKTVLVNEKNRWKLIEPLKAEADDGKVMDLLNKLADLRASGKDVIDKVEPAHGLGKAATVVRLTVQEPDRKAKDDRAKKTRIITLHVGKEDPVAKKVYVQAEGFARVNAVVQSLAPLVFRPALAYRGRRVLDYTIADLDTITVQGSARKGEPLTLKQGKSGWRVTAPFAAEADGTAADGLASALSGLEALEYVDETPKAADLDGKYGLAKPGLAVTLTFRDGKRPARTLEIGSQTKDRRGYHARLAGTMPVFVLSAELRGQLVRDALAYLPLPLWQTQPNAIAVVRLQKEGTPEYRLEPAGKNGAMGYRVAGPFEAPAQTRDVEEAKTALAAARCEKYVAGAVKELAEYGLDKPYLKVSLKLDDGKEHALLIGKPVDGDGKHRYAQLLGQPAVGIIDDRLLTAIDRTALEWLDPQLLEVDAKRIARFGIRSGDTSLRVLRKGESWQVQGGPGEPFAADAEAVAALENAWLNLRAERFVAYGAKVALEKYGLDHPTTATLHLTQARRASEGTQHTVELGAEVESERGARYARLDHGPAIAILTPGVARALTSTYLDLVDHTMLKLDATNVTRIHCDHAKDARVLEVEKKDDHWSLVKPREEAGDDPSIQELLTRMASLRARRVAAYPVPKDKLEQFGLDRESAVRVTLTLEAAGKKTEQVLALGKVVDAVSGDRYAWVKGGAAVMVLAGDVAGPLAAGPLAFRDRLVASFTTADRVQLQRGPRKAAFAQEEGTWKLVEPFKGEADHDALEDFISKLARLRADALVAEKPDAATLKKFGLDRPEVRWRLQSSDRDVLTLLVGNEEAGGRRRYARLDGGSLVFLLDPGLSARVTGEFRPRTVWTPPLDASQVVALRYRTGANILELERGDTGWQIKDKPDAKVDASVVNDTLAALAGLKLQRYAVDRDADLRLFGLRPPQTVVEVVTRLGQYELHIGALEGGTQNRYARLPVPGRTDVFVLDAAICGHILRDRSAFTQSPAKAPKSIR